MNKRWMITKKDFTSKVASWPDVSRLTFRSLDRQGKLEGFRSKEQAEAAMPTELKTYCTVREYISL